MAQQNFILILNFISGIQNGFDIFVVTGAAAEVARDDRLLPAAEIGLPQVVIPSGLDVL